LTDLQTLFGYLTSISLTAETFLRYVPVQEV
jgi:hypothetical protein